VCEYTTLKGIFDIENPQKTAIALLVDKEEIGSAGNTGMKSEFFRMVIAQMIELEKGVCSVTDLNRAISKSACLSSDVNAAVDHVTGRFDGYVIDSSVMGRIDEQVIKALFGTQAGERNGSLGLIETFSAASAIKAADIAVKTARVEIYDLRVSRGMGGKGVVMLTGDVGDVTAAVEAGANYAKDISTLSSYTVIPAPHEELWKQM
jgi:microcompartment protein CcmL/EutN